MGIVFLLCILQPSHGQDTTVFTPAKAYKHAPNGPYDFFKKALAVEFTDIQYKSKNQPSKYDLDRLNKQRLKVLDQFVDQGLFLSDDSLETYINSIIKTICEHNSFPAYARRAFVMRYPQVNAMCYGRGTFFVTTACIARFDTEDELAFVIAHEIAHDELQHVKEKVLWEALNNFSYESWKHAKKMIAGAADLSEVEAYRQAVYGITRHDRQKELRADSMALVLVSNAGYDQAKAIAAVPLLEGSMGLKRGSLSDLFAPFDNNEYPFQVEWLEPRLQVYSKERPNLLMLSTDSASSHPDFEIRLKSLKREASIPQLGTTHQDKEFVAKMVERAEYETVESEFQLRYYDFCLYYALQLMEKYPSDSYLVSRIGKTLLEVYNAKNEGFIDYYVSKYTVSYGEEARTVNNFLLNLSITEIKESGYHFLKDPRHFNAADKAHYFLLWKFCELTNRREEASEVRRAFRDKFDGNISGYVYK